MDLVIWGHEHECLIDPTLNPEMNFHVMQPGSSVATSLCPGEAVAKHVAILTVQGRDFRSESIRLKSVRPFVMKEIVLAEEKGMKNVAKKANNRTEITRFLEDTVHEMIEQANEEWLEAQGDRELDEDEKPPLPLVRLRVEYTAPEGGDFECENPQRFSSRFVNKVANTQDVVQFHRRKAKSAARLKPMGGAEVPDDAQIASSFALDSNKVERLVREFLDNQSLTMFPQNSFSDAVAQYVEKDDKHAMEAFVKESLETQIKSLKDMDGYVYEGDLQDALLERKSYLEEMFAQHGISRGAKRKPKPDGWDSDLNGHWADDVNAVIHSDEEEEEEGDSDVTIAKPSAKGRGRGAAVTKKAAAPKKAPSKNSRSKKKLVEDDSEEDEDMMMVDDGSEEESQLFVEQESAPPKRGGRKKAATPAKAAPTKATTQRRAPARTSRNQPARQTMLEFQSQAITQSKSQTQPKVEISNDEISDDDDAFAPPSRPTRNRR